MFLPVYDPSFTTTPQPVSWYLTLFYLLTVVSSKIHYNTRYFQIEDKNDELRHLAESYLCSGGLMSPADRTNSFVLDVFDNAENRFDELHAFFDGLFPEPAWRRKHQPVVVNLELKILAVYVYHNRLDAELEAVFNALLERRKNPEVSVTVSEELRTVWRCVLKMRELLRSKKQEFANIQTMSVNRSNTNTIHFVRRSSTTPDNVLQTRMKEYSLRIRKSMTTTMNNPGSSVVNSGMRRLMTFEGEQGDMSPSTIMDVQQHVEADNVQPAESYDEYVDEFMRKLELLMELNHPLDLEACDDHAEWLKNVMKNEEPAVEVKKSGEEKGVVPSTVSELINVSITKYLSLFIPASVNDVHRTLDARTENAFTLSHTVDDAVVLLKTIEDFPQAARLFLLGLAHALVNWKSSKAEDSYRRDYLHHTEGCSRAAYTALRKSWMKFGEYLKSLFSKCVMNLNWRLGVACLYMLSSMNSAKQPYYSSILQLPHFFATTITSLSKWYGSLTGHFDELLISPGPLWDKLGEKTIALNSPFFRAVLEDFQNRGNYVSSKSSVQGIFPLSLLMLTNTARLSFILLLMDQVVDHRIKSTHSAAQNSESLFFWTVNDVSNLFVRQSPQYRSVTRALFAEFFAFLQHEQSVMNQLTELWHPFAHSLYSQVNVSINPNACIQVSDEKNNKQGSIENDMAISAGEGLLSSYLGLLVFVAKTGYFSCIPFADNAPMLWNMMYYSPRMQRLTLMLFEKILSATSWVPSLPPHQFIHPLTAPNPLLEEPSLPRAEDQRRFFVIQLLHIASHSDTCVAAIVSERASCTLCCPYDVICYHWLYDEALTKSQKIQLLTQFHDDSNHITRCTMHIRADGHGASYSAMITAEEAVYTLRAMMKNPEWSEVMAPLFVKIVLLAEASLNEEKEEQLWAEPAPFSSPRTTGSQEYEDALHSRLPWLVLVTSVLKVMGGLTPRLYTGCRIRMQDVLMDSNQDGSGLIRTAWSNSGNGYVINCDRGMSEAEVLLDRIETPMMMSIYGFDVIDRLLPPSFGTPFYTQVIEPLQHMFLCLPLAKELMAMPTRTMPFFNTSALSLQPHLLQNVTLSLYTIRALHYTILNTPQLVASLHPTMVSALFRIAVKPVPSNVTFSSSTIRQYVNWFVEYLINTYPGSPRFLPMELQMENYAKEMERQCGSYSTGLGKDEVKDSWNDQKPKVLYDEKRMNVAKTIATITGYDEEVCYKIYRSFQDNMEAAVNYIMESKKSFIHDLADDCSHIVPIGSQIDDDSVLIDLETSIRKPLLASSVSRGRLSDTMLSTLVPPFSRLQCVTEVKTDGVARSSSLYGVISCISNQELIYAPVSPIGVITAIVNGKVRLSVLNIETGLVEDMLVDEKQVSVQKYRILFHLDDVHHLRGIVGRLTEILLQLYTRELVIGALYTMQERNDVIDSWQLNSYDVVRLMKFTYLSYTQSLQTIPSSHETASLQTCLFKLLQLAIKQIISTSSRAFTLIQSFMDGTWDDTDNNKVTLYVPPEEERAPPLMSVSSKQLAVSSISLGNQQQDNSVYVSSLHPSFPKTKYSDKVTIPGAAGLRILFDPRCYLDPEKASLTFFQDDALTQVIARFSGDAELFCPFTIRGNTVRFMYESDMSESKQWGYGFLIQPFENVNWNNDGDVLSTRCFDWNCFAYDLLIDISKEYDFKEDDFFNRTFNNLILYLRTSGVPFKARVVELLMRIIHSHNIHLATHPDVSGMLHSVITYCEHIDQNTIVPSQLPLLLDFLMTYTLHDRILETIRPAKSDAPIPAFDAKTPALEDSLFNHLMVVHLLVRCVYYHSTLPQDLCRGILQTLGLEWTEENYVAFMKSQPLFTASLDNELIQCFTQHAIKTNQSLITARIADFALNDDDQARYYNLCEIETASLHHRLAVFQFFNLHLQHCINLIELLSTGNNTVKSVGTLITLLSNYVFPVVKEDVLEIMIKQTEYCGPDAYPVIELDNRKVFTDLEKDDDFDGDAHSIMTSQCMFAQLYHQMKHVNCDVLRAKLDSKDRVIAIKYKGEQGLDWGGLYRDTIERW